MKIFSLFSLLSALFLVIDDSYADFDLSEITVPGFYANNIVGAPIASGEATQSSPVVAEIDNNVKNGKEIAIVSNEAQLTVLSSSGKIIWQVDLPNRNIDSDQIRIGSSPAVGRLNGKKKEPYVVVGYGSFSASSSGGVAAYRGKDGRLLFDFNSKKYGTQRRKFGEGYNERLHSIISTPALADVTNNRKLEIAFGGWNRHLFLLNNKGNVLWYYQAGDTVWSSPALANLNSRAGLEMVAATDISKNEKINPPTPNGGMMYSFKSNLNSLYKKAKNLLIPFRSSKAINWYRTADQTFFSSPVVADVNPKHAGKEIIIGTGYFFPEKELPKNGANIKIYNKKGKLISLLPLETFTSSSVAIADIDFDGRNEIISLVTTDAQFGGKKGHLNAWKAVSKNKFTQLWDTQVATQNAYNNFSSPIIADLDGNGSLEIIIANRNVMRIFDSATGNELTRKSNKEIPRLTYGGYVKSTPAVDDINNDGILDLIFPTTYEDENGTTRGAIAAYTNFHLWLNSAAPAKTNAPRYAVPWGQWRGNAQKTGVF